MSSLAHGDEHKLVRKEERCLLEPDDCSYQIREASRVANSTFVASQFQRESGDEKLCRSTALD